MMRHFFNHKTATALLAAALLAGLGGCARQDAATETERPIAVRTILPARIDLSHRLEYLGTVRSQKEVNIIARAQGTVMRLPFAEGETVSVGDTVAVLDAPELRAVVQRLQAEKDYWCRRYESDQRLVKANALPREQMEVSKRACTSATAAHTEARSRLAKTAETSPVAGEVLQWFVEPGQSVMPGQPILLLGNRVLEIHTDVIEEDLQKGIQPGTAAVIEPGNRIRFNSRVTEVSPMSKGPARTFTVKLSVPASQAAALRNGASVNVNFILRESKSTLAVPISAIADRDRQPHIFVIRDDLAFRQPVRLGIEQNGWIEADFPWNGSDAVAITNLASLKDSVRVYSVPVKEVKP